MDLIGYTMDLESLISRYTFLIFTEIVPIILVLFLTWFLPYLKKRTKKTHHKQKGVEAKYDFDTFLSMMPLLIAFLPPHFAQFPTYSLQRLRIPLLGRRRGHG